MEHTQANAIQRGGRAGRTADGRVWYLFTTDQFEAREKNLKPEILRTNLTAQILQMKAMGIADVHVFDYIDHPGREKIDRAISTLHKLGAIDDEDELTDIGREMVEIDADPHYARMIVEAKKRDCLDAVTLLIGLMSNKKSIYSYDFFPKKKFSEKYGRFIIPGSDFLTQLNIWNEYLDYRSNPEQREEWSLRNGINTYLFYNAANTRRELLDDFRPKNEKIDLSDGSQKDIALCIASGLMDSILKTDNNGSYHLTDGALKGVNIGKNSIFQSGFPQKLISGSIRFIESINRTFAEFNMLYDENHLREAAPYLFPEKQVKKEPESPFPPKRQTENRTEEIKISNKPMEPQYTEFRPIPRIIPPSVRKTFTFKDVLFYIPRTIARGIKYLTSLITRPVARVIQSIRRWF